MLSLPTGAVIDATDMDAWRFPLGTRVWMGFVRDGVAVETRYLSLRTDALATPASTPAHRTAIGGIVRADEPEDSELLARFRSRGAFVPRMPALGTTRVNPEAESLLRAWIQELR